MKSIVLALILLGFQLSFAEEVTPQSSATWIVENSWNTEWEQKFSDWVAKEVNPDFYQKYNISTDCADAAIGLRWIFARDNKLPAANTVLSIENGQITKRELFTHESRGPWSQLPTAHLWFEDKRFISVLKALFNKTFTQSLFEDSYPVALDRKFVRPGAFYISKFENTGHAEIIARTDFRPDAMNPIVFFSSTVPAEVRVLNVDPLIKSAVPTRGSDGLMSMRWPVKIDNVWVLVGLEQMPGYSLQQFSTSEMAKFDYFFDDFLVRKLTGREQAPKIKVSRLAEAIIKKFKDRVLIVEAGFKTCAPNKCVDPSPIYDDYSTPSRDGNIRYFVASVEGLLYLLEDTFGNNGINSGYAGTVKSTWSKYLRQEVLSIDGNQLSLSDLIEIWSKKRFSSNPNDSIAQRWGI